MLLVAQLDESHCIKTTTNKDYQKVDNAPNLLNIVKNIRSELPAITHVDYSARYRLLRKHKITDTTD